GADGGVGLQLIPPPDVQRATQCQVAALMDDLGALVHVHEGSQGYRGRTGDGDGVVDHESEGARATTETTSGPRHRPVDCGGSGGEGGSGKAQLPRKGDGAVDRPGASTSRF